MQTRYERDNANAASYFLDRPVIPDFRMTAVYDEDNLKDVNWKISNSVGPLKGFDPSFNPNFVVQGKMEQEIRPGISQSTWWQTPLIYPFDNLRVINERDVNSMIDTRNEMRK